MATDMDMLSLLPDSLLIIILSFLPFKEAARTCTLSKRWSKMWESTRNIDFNELDFVNAAQYDNQTKQQEQRSLFLCFITNWMSHYKDSNLDKFSLKISRPENCLETVQNCIDFVAAKRGVKELRLDFSDPNWNENDHDHNNDQKSTAFDLPEQFYDSYQTLESLKLYSCSFHMSKLLNFRSLKEVSFGWIEITTSTLVNLLSTCKLIENLSLKCCRNMQDFDMGNGSLGLKRLVIEKCKFKYECFRFNAPCLEYFKYCGQVLRDSEINVRPHVMEEADIDFGFVSEFEECGNEIYRVLEDLYPVRVLTVCSVLLQVVPSGEEPIRVQCGLNVRHLTMKTQMHDHELCGFMFLLNSCPRLDKLTLDIAPQKILPGYSTPYRVDLNKFWDKVAVPSCVRRTLKVVELKGFTGTMDELMACYYFIQAGRVLENINIYVFKEEEEEEDEKLHKKLQCRHAKARYLLTLPKASRILKINIII